MKVITRTALGALINRLPDGVELMLQNNHRAYLGTQHLGQATVWDSEFVHYKHGSPVVVEDWLNSFGLNTKLNPSADIVLASLLNIGVTFKLEAKEHFFNYGSKTFKRALHRNAFETSVPELYRLPLNGADPRATSLDAMTKKSGSDNTHGVQIYISRTRLDIAVFDKFIRSTYPMDLHVPYADAELDERIDPLSSIPMSINGDKYTVNETTMITKFEMNNRGAVAKQAALMSAICGCASIPTSIRHRKIEVIDSRYYVYFTINNSLALAIEVDEDDFVLGEGTVEDFISRDAYIAKPL